MSSDHSTVLMYGVPLTNTEIKYIEEKFGEDIEDHDLGNCEAFMYGNMVSGDTFIFLGISESQNWGPLPHKVAEPVAFESTENWDKELSKLCNEAGFTEGWVNRPGWYLMSYYG